MRNGQLFDRLQALEAGRLQAPLSKEQVARWFFIFFQERGCGAVYQNGEHKALCSLSEPTEAEWQWYRDPETAKQVSLSLAVNMQK